jgi:hypothetical protein
MKLRTTPNEWTMPNRKWILAIIFVSVLPFHGIAQNAASEKSTVITGNELIKLLHGGSDGYSRALDYIGKIYGEHFNKGTITDKPTLIALAEIVDDYLFTPGRKWDVPAEGLVIKALREVAKNPALLQKRLEFTGNKLMKMLKGSSENWLQAEKYIGEVFIKNFNTGLSLEELSLVELVRVTENYLNSPGRNLDRPAEALATEALRDVPAAIKEQENIWENIYSAGSEYFALPSKEHAEKFYLALPTVGTRILSYKGHDKVSLLILNIAQSSYENFRILRNKILEGDPYSVDIGFRLMNLVDGASAEDLCFTLGKLVPRLPRLFLQKLSAHQSDTNALNDLDCMLNPLPWDEAEKYKDEAQMKEAWKREQEVRIRALESVEDPGLQELKNRCLDMLRKMTIGWP